jgi:hypothetical protein
VPNLTAAALGVDGANHIAAGNDGAAGAQPDAPTMPAPAVNQVSTAAGGIHLDPLRLQGSKPKLAVLKTYTVAPDPYIPGGIKVEKEGQLLKVRWKMDTMDLTKTLNGTSASIRFTQDGPTGRKTTSKYSRYSSAYAEYQAYFQLERDAEAIIDASLVAHPEVSQSVSMPPLHTPPESPPAEPTAGSSASATVETIPVQQTSDQPAKETGTKVQLEYLGFWRAELADGSWLLRARAQGNKVEYQYLYENEKGEWTPLGDPSPDTSGELKEKGQFKVRVVIIDTETGETITKEFEELYY